MRIALVRQRYTDDGGAERFVARALTALQARGIQVTVIARRWQRDTKVEAITCNPFYLGNVWRDLSFARAACALTARGAWDLVQSHERIACCDIYRAGDGVHREWLRQRRRTLSAWRQFALMLNPYHHYAQAAEQALFASPRLRAVICNSQMVKEEIQHYFGFPGDKLHVIYSGVDLQAFEPGVRSAGAAVRTHHGIPADAPLFLFVGSGFERKGLAALIAALARLPENAHAVVVGRDKNAHSYRAQVQRLRARVHFAGRQADVRPYYGAADALVLPTLYDPFPNVVLEALACGLPAIVSNKCGGAELIEAGVNGYVCDALDIAALAKAMREIVQIPEATRRDAARATVAAFGLEQMSAQLLALYERLLIERRG